MNRTEADDVVIGHPVSACLQASEDQARLQLKEIWLAMYSSSAVSSALHRRQSDQAGWIEMYMTQLLLVALRLRRKTRKHHLPAICQSGPRSATQTRKPTTAVLIQLPSSIIGPCPWRFFDLKSAVCRAPAQLPILRKNVKASFTRRRRSRPSSTLDLQQGTIPLFPRKLSPKPGDRGESQNSDGRCLVPVFAHRGN